MTTISTLGPANTFSELAAKRYGKDSRSDFSIKLYPTIGKAFDAVGKDCSCAVLPIENMAEGYVSIVLDLLVHSELFIVDELLVAIQFSLACNCKSLDQVDKVYAQFVSQGQCSLFLDNLEDINIITTPSNGTSLEQLQKGLSGEAAIVPTFAVKEGDFPLIIRDISDHSNNQTRFITIAPNPTEYDHSVDYKTSLLVVESVDKPGVLSNILSAFSKRNINLVSIMSRPTKEMLGRYHFFIDVEGHYEESRIKESIFEIEKENTIRILGSYPKAQKLIDIQENESDEEDNGC